MSDLLVICAALFVLFRQMNRVQIRVTVSHYETLWSEFTSLTSSARKIHDQMSADCSQQSSRFLSLFLFHSFCLCF